MLNSRIYCHFLLRLDDFDIDVSYFSATDYLDHIKKCEFAYIDCPFKGCKALVLRGKKSDHIASCEYRPVTCTKGCDTQYRWKDRSSHSCIKALKKVVKG